MGAETWIDDITDLWAAISDFRGSNVHSYKVFKKEEFPESITEVPAAITYITSLPVVQYSAGGPSILVYSGVTEFHLTQSVAKNQYPYVMRFYDPIIQAAAAHVTLFGKVSHFVLTGEPPIRPGILQYGSESPHLGIMVNWQVKETPVITVEA